MTASRAARGDAAIRTREIAPDVHCLGPWGRTWTNVYFVRAGGVWALVDAGWNGDAERIEAAARSLLGRSAPPSLILLTHVHPDHAGSARRLARRWGCCILLHPGEEAIARGDLGAMSRAAGPLDRWLILPALRAVGERRRAAILARGSLAGELDLLGPDGLIPGLEGWAWVATPGHTPGHVSFVRGSDRTVITGDALLTLEVNSWTGILLGRRGLSGPPWYTTFDRRAAAASIEAIAALEPSVVAGGHGEPWAGRGTAGAVRTFAERQARAER